MELLRILEIIIITRIIIIVVIVILKVIIMIILSRYNSIRMIAIIHNKINYQENSYIISKKNSNIESDKYRYR